MIYVLTVIAIYAQDIVDMFNVSYKKNGGMRFLKIGRLCVSWCVTKQFRPMKAAYVKTYPLYPETNINQNNLLTA